MSKSNSPNEQEQNSGAGQEQEPTASGATTAVLEKPKQFEDHDKVIVLYGWNKVPAGYRQYVDKTLFKDGIARDVPYSTVKHWQRGTRPDGKQDMTYGKIGIQAVLPNDATETDFCKATGVTPMPAEKFAAQLAGTDLEALVTLMGVEKVKAFIDGLEKHLPPAQRRA